MSAKTAAAAPVTAKVKKAAAGIMETAGPALVAAWNVVSDDRRRLRNARLAFGAIVNETVASLLAAGLPITDAQASVLGVLPETVEWSTVQGWTRAHGVYLTLDEETRTAIDNGTGPGIDGLCKLGTVPATVKEGDLGLSRQDVATVAMAEGLTSDRDIRTAVAAAKGTTPGASRKSKTPTGAAAIETAHAKYHEALRALFSETFTTTAWTPDVQALVTAAAMIGCRVGRGGKAPTKAQSQALESLTYLGPLADDSESDEA
jgi:hypothetical protein